MRFYDKIQVQNMKQKRINTNSERSLYSKKHILKRCVAAVAACAVITAAVPTVWQTTFAESNIISNSTLDHQWW